MSDKPAQQQIKVRYNETSALYASQFIINTTQEDVTLNFSSGPLTDPASGETILPIHTRIAMSVGAVRRLHNVLGSILKQQAGEAPEAAQAQFPKIQ